MKSSNLLGWISSELEFSQVTPGDIVNIGWFDGSKVVGRRTRTPSSLFSKLTDLFLVVNVDKSETRLLNIETLKPLLTTTRSFGFDNKEREVIRLVMKMDVT